MQTTGIPSQKLLAGVSVLKSANRQAQLAGDLINRTIENMQNQNLQTPAQPMDVSGSTGTGKIINTTA